MYQAILKEVTDRMKRSIAAFADEIRKIRGGRAQATLVADMKVNYYGAATPLKQLAAISVPDPKSILIQPFDKNALGDIETAIRNSELNLSPVNDGTNVRLNLPPLSLERRAEFIKIVKTKAEEANISLKLARQDGWQKVKDLEASKQITEDDRYRAEEELNKIVVQHKDEIEKLSGEKETELKEI